MEKEKKNLLTFGYGLVILICLFVWRHSRHDGVTLLGWVFLSLSGILLVVTARDYKRIKPFYKKWMSVAHFIATIVTAVILSVLFYGVFGVTGIILRLCKKDILSKNQWAKPVGSYWQKREVAPFDKNQYLKQF